MRTFTQLFRKSQHSVKNYRTDFVHDFKAIKKNPSAPYVHITRDNGTTMIIMRSEADIWAEIMESKFNELSDMKRVIDDVVNWNLTLLKHYIENPNLFHHFDSKTLKRVQSKTAENVVREWARITRDGLETRLKNLCQTIES
ncbi:MAG: hypothetical protein ACI9DM_000232 [Cyclobacteriaceae bacterium]|jgi:hypothetical protein